MFAWTLYKNIVNLIFLKGHTPLSRTTAMGMEYRGLFTVALSVS